MLSRVGQVVLRYAAGSPAGAMHTHPRQANPAGTPETACPTWSIAAFPPFSRRDQGGLSAGRALLRRSGPSIVPHAFPASSSEMFSTLNARPVSKPCRAGGSAVRRRFACRGDAHPSTAGEPGGYAGTACPTWSTAAFPPFSRRDQGGLSAGRALLRRSGPSIVPHAFPASSSEMFSTLNARPVSEHTERQRRSTCIARGRAAHPGYADRPSTSNLEKVAHTPLA